MSRSSLHRAATFVRWRGATWLPATLAAALTLACTGHIPPAEWTLDLVELVTVGQEPVMLQTAFYLPADLDTDAAGNVYVLDTGNHRVQVFGPDGGYVRTLGHGAGGPGKLTTPQGLWVGPDGDVVVADTRSRSLVSFGHDGQPGPRLDLDFPPLDVVAHRDRLYVLRMPSATMLLGADASALVRVVDRDGNELDGMGAAVPADVGILYLLENSRKLAAAPEGGIALVNTHIYSRLRIFASTGVLRREIPVLYKAETWAPLGERPSQWNDQTVERVARTAAGLAWDGNRRLWWVLAGYVDRTPDGEWIIGRELYRYDVDGIYRGTLVLPQPTVSVAASLDGRVWTLDIDGVLHGWQVTDPEGALPPIESDNETVPAP